MNRQSWVIVCLIISFSAMLPSIVVALMWAAFLLLIGKLTRNSNLVRYSFNQLISLDQLVNTVCGGDPDETISSRMGKWARDHKNNSGIKKPLFKVANFVVELFEKDHFKNAIEEDEGKNKTVE
jgi:hypothetical protein